MKALFITRHYLDQMLGGPNCSKAFVRALADIYPGLTVIYPEHDDIPTQLDFLNACPPVVLEPVYDRRSRLRKLVDMYMGRLHRFYRFVPQYLGEHSFDVIFIDHSFTASSGVIQAVAGSGAKVVTLHHNVESQYIHDNQQSVLFRYPYNHFSLLAERNAVRYSDLNLVLTEYDRKAFSETFPQKAGSMHTVGVFEYEESAEKRLSCAHKHSFVISGSLCARQTEVPMIDFLDNYMDVLNDVCPDAQLIITGRNPSHLIYEKAKRFSNIKIVPNPDDLVGEVVKANYYLCPIYTGGGLKLRCMDALRVGLPVLAHRNAMRGYEAVCDDGFMLSYSSKEDFGFGISRLIGLGDCHADVADSFNSHFSFAAGRERLRNILYSFL